MSTSKEVAFISQSLLLHKGPAIQKFSLTFQLPEAEPHHVNSWIYFAKIRDVKELYLDFRNNQYRGIPSAGWYRLPRFLFSSTSLTVLSLIRCEKQFLYKFKLSSLKTLSLEEVHCSRTVGIFLAYSTPILESLSLTNCIGFGLLSGRKLKTLKIRESDEVSSNYMLRILALSTVSFELVTRMPRKFIWLYRMYSLGSARLGCNEVNCGKYKVDKEHTVFGILDIVCHAKYLRLCSCYIQTLCNDEGRSLKCLATCLEMKINLTKEELPGISYMLRHSPNIKTLIISIDKIQTKKVNNNSEGGDYWKLQEPNFADLLCNVKDVKIYNFLKNLEVLESKQMNTTEDFLALLQNDMNFLRFLLKNCKVMERMTITTFEKVNFGPNSENKKLKLLLQLTQELLTFPRASQAAQISFN